MISIGFNCRDPQAYLIDSQDKLRLTWMLSWSWYQQLPFKVKTVLFLGNDICLNRLKFGVNIEPLLLLILGKKLTYQQVRMWGIDSPETINGFQNVNNFVKIDLNMHKQSKNIDVHALFIHLIVLLKVWRALPFIFTYYKHVIVVEFFLSSLIIFLLIGTDTGRMT